MDEFYGTADGYRAYHEARGRDVTADIDPAINSALLVASEWLDGAFRSSFGGYKVDRAAQVREWPRYLAVDADGWPIDYTTVPTRIERATYEVAYRYLREPTVLNADFTPNKYKRVAIAGAVTVEYNMLTASSATTQFPILADILAPLMTATYGNGLSSRVVRA